MENYSTVTKLGKGACGEVFLVRHNETAKLYALKTIQLDEGRKNRTKTAVMREAKILAQLKHPNIVAYQDSFFNEGEEHLCIVQDYCDGGTLDDNIQEAARKREYLPEKQVMQWFIQITMAVQYMHSQKVLHRDLKTQNVFMNKGGNTCRLGDFGISKMMDTTIDMASTCVGTPCYLAPEMCQDIPYSSKADVWALGCLLYEMCALRPAFDANNLISLFYKIVKADVDRLPSQYSEKIMELIRTILVKSPEERPSARQILVLPYVKEQMSDFIIELMTISEMREKESPSNKNKKASKSSRVPSNISNSAESSPIIKRRWNKSIDNAQLSQTFESAIKLPIPITPRTGRDAKYKCLYCGQAFTLKSFLTKHIDKKHQAKTIPGSSQSKEQQSRTTPNKVFSSADKQRLAAELDNDPDYEDDFEDSEDEDNKDSSRDRDVNEDEIQEDIDEDPDDITSDDYEDDFEEYDSDEDLDGIVSHCKELHEGDHQSDEDEMIIDQEPSKYVASYKNLLQEHAIQTLGKTKYTEIQRHGKLNRITEEDITLKVEHKAGQEHLETCFLVSELL